MTTRSSALSPALSPELVDRYLDRIGVATAAHRLTPSIDTLATLQRAHLQTVPFENLDIVRGRPVTTDVEASVRKVVDDRRGGWCFEVNGAFAALLEALGFDVLRLGAAVLLDGPSTLIDHLCLEVWLGEPWLVDVGFGDSFVCPLRLNRAGSQDGGKADFEFIASPQGTTLAEHVDGLPAACYRFKRVAHQMADFDAVSDLLQTDPTRHWSTKPFATRLLGEKADRVTLLSDRLKIRREGIETVRPVVQAEWPELLDAWFLMKVLNEGD